MTHIETIQKRKSIRTFTKDALSSQDISKIIAYLDDSTNLIGPFGGSTTITFHTITDTMRSSKEKIGTYGVIKNPQAYLVGVCDNSSKALLDYGYTFEKLLLYMVQLGIGTCWLGGTIKKAAFDNKVDIGPGQLIPAVTPLGYPKDGGRVFESAMRALVKADNKMQWNELFYNTDFDTPLDLASAGRLKLPIEMVRIGPSASNKQPWRLLLSSDKQKVHLYLAHTPNYSGNKLGYEMQKLDMGIAMCHFELACNDQNIDGKWLVDAPTIKAPDMHEYIATWTIA